MKVAVISDIHANKQAFEAVLEAISSSDATEVWCLGDLVGYGADPDAKSHGEAFLNFFQQRLVPKGLYLMDEPEAALSPQRQLSLLALMFDLVAEGAQFIIATHAPMLLAFPGARIYSFDESPIAEVPWDRTDHVRLTREFLAEPERYLRNLRS